MNKEKTLPKGELGRMVDCTLTAFRTALARHADLMAGHRSMRTSGSQRVSLLCNNLQVINDRYTYTRTSVRDAISEIAARLQPGKVLFANACAPGDVWRTPSVLNLAITKLDPVLATMLPFDRQSGWESWQGARALPLAERLKNPTDCMAVAQELRRMQTEIDHAVEHDLIDENLTLIALAESLMAIADTLEQIGKSWPLMTPRWCACCFRRAPRSSLYCNLHRSGQKNDGKDTFYRKAMRTRASFSKVTDVQWSRHQAIRHVLAEPHQRLVGPGSAWVPHDGPSAVVTDDILLLALRSELLGDWVSVWPIWDAFIRRICPVVAQRLGDLISNTTNWWDFCRKLHRALCNRHEDTTNPLSILYLLVEAEDWFVAEQTCQDRRVTDNAHRIAVLSSAGVSALQISQQLGLSRQYVYRRLKSLVPARQETDLHIGARA